MIKQLKQTTIHNQRTKEKIQDLKKKQKFLEIGVTSINEDINDNLQAIKEIPKLRRIIQKNQEYLSPFHAINNSPKGTEKRSKTKMGASQMSLDNRSAQDEISINKLNYELIDAQ